MKALRGKTALVTGASRGIGPHIAGALAQQGMNLVLTARKVSSLAATEAAAKAIGVRVSSIAADMRQRADIEMLAQRADAESGGIAVLVNNAGIECAMPYDRIDPKMIDAIIAVNLTAPMILTRLLLPRMIGRGEGHVVNIASLSGLVGTPYEEAYSASKHGLVGFTRSLRLSLRSEGHSVSASAICPGFIQDAGMYNDAAGATGVTAPGMLGTVPLRKVTAAVVRAILNDEAVVALSGQPIRPFLAIQTLAPKLAERMSAMIGVPAMFKKWAAAAMQAGQR